MKSLTCAAILCFSMIAWAQSTQSKSYAGDNTTNFMNPDRGWHRNNSLIGDGNYDGIRSDNMTLTRCYVRLDSYRGVDLPQSLLDEHTTRFGQVRAAGVKIVLRYCYNFDGDGADAPIDRVLRHIAQLKPYWQANADVISVLQAGFIGAWGEWHSSASGLDSETNRQRIAEALLDALPPSRMIQIRYPRYIMDLYPTALNGTQAFRGSSQARIGSMNDSFLRNFTDAGTYMNPDYTFNQAQKDYTIALSPWAVMGGETVEDVTWTDGNRQSCTAAPAEMAMLNWDYLNRDYAQSVITPWINNGCYDEISLKLGYRLRLTCATLPTSISNGSSIGVTLEMTNDGWGKVYNPRHIDLVLRSQSASNEYRIVLSEDARLLLPKGGTSKSLDLSAAVPAIPQGQYSVFLHLADPSPSIAARPEYSIRLANTNMWQAATGYNDLQMSVQVGGATMARHVSVPTRMSTASARTYDIRGRLLHPGISAHGYAAMVLGPSLVRASVIDR